MSEVEILILKVLLLLVVGLVGAIVARKLKIPNVTGYILLGLIIGPSLGLLFPNFNGIITFDDSNKLSFFNDITLGFIGLAIGSELSFSYLKKSGKKVLTITVFEVIGAVTVVFLLLFFLPKPSPIMPEGYNPFAKGNIAFGLVLASMSAATAPAATLMVVRQYRAYGPLTKTIIPITALDDISGITVFGFAMSIASVLTNSAGNQSVVLMIFRPFLEILGAILIGAVIGFVFIILIKKLAKNRDNTQVLGIIIILFTNGLIAFLNHILTPYGISFSQLFANIVVGAIVANLSKKAEQTFNIINDFSAPFYIIFFTLAGASLNIEVLKSNYLVIIIAVVYIIGRGTGIIAGANMGARITKSEKTLKKYLGFSLLPQGGVSLGLLIVVKSQLPGEYYDLIFTVIMLGILFYETTGPLFSKFALKKAGEINGLDKLETLDFEFKDENLAQNPDAKLIPCTAETNNAPEPDKLENLNLEFRDENLIQNQNTEFIPCAAGTNNAPEEPGKLEILDFEFRDENLIQNQNTEFIECSVDETNIKPKGE